MAGWGVLRVGLRRGAYYAACTALAAPFMLPLFWMVSTAFRPAAAVYASPPQWLPRSPTLSNFRQAWGLLDFPLFMRNSFLVTGLTVLGTLSSSSLVGYAFALLPGRGKKTLFSLLLATTMVPASVTLIPVFILFSKLGWVNTYLPLIAPPCFASPFFVLIFRQFFRTLPPELFECAELDGCNPLTAYWHVALPLSRPALAMAAVFAFAGAWNDFLGPLVYLSSNERFTLALGLSLFEGLHYSQLHYLMPMCLVALAPVLALFLLAQRYVMRGILAMGMKS